ncbi:MAG: fumarylacetoacetate hydrolase family protein [Terriglobales bacterium]|jgi:2-keto-4-pentenoate hydratase/2-oxohepta-3-ene-1,7-dioic acid hydratase in catechol pathway
MKYCRFHLNGSAHYGLVEPVAGNDEITRLLLQPPQSSDGDVEGLPSRRMDHIPLAQASLLPPVEPSKIVCIGRNYREHAAELGHDVPLEPLIFLKPPSSLLPPGATILRPKVSERTDYEGELGVVIARRCRQLAEGDDVRPYILGYTCVNDFTARDLQNKDGQWTRAKGFDTFCPVGPVVTDGKSDDGKNDDGTNTDGTSDDGIDADGSNIDPWAGVSVETRVNGEVKQSGNTRDFIFPLDVIIRYISQIMTLEPGDLISTGTPKGVGPVVAGDVIEVSIPGIGVLRNAVADRT